MSRARVAAAFGGVPAGEFGYALNFAADMARYAVANGVVVPSDGAVVQARPVPGFGVPSPGMLPPALTPGTPERQKAGKEEIGTLRWLWNRLTGAGEAEIVPFAPSASSDAPGSSGGGPGSVTPMRPPVDPDDEGEGRPPRVRPPGAKVLEGPEPGREGAPGATGDREAPTSLKGMRKLSDQDAGALENSGPGAHELKDGQGDAHVDLYVDKRGNIYI